MQREGLLGVGLQIQPVSYFYEVKLSQTPGRTIVLGPKVWVAYPLFLYPDLQIGHALWLSNASLAPQVLVEQRVGETNRLVAKLSSSVLAVTSRPDQIEPYFFSLRAGDLIRDLHTNPQLGSTGQFSQTDVSVDYRINGPKRDWAIGYDLTYIHYKQQPTFQSLTHGVSLTFYRR